MIDDEPIPDSLRYQVLTRDRWCLLCGATAMASDSVYSISVARKPDTPVYCYDLLTLWVVPGVCRKGIFFMKLIARLVRLGSAVGRLICLFRLGRL